MRRPTGGVIYEHEGNRGGETRLLSGPVDLCRICLRRVRTGLSAIWTAGQDRYSSVCFARPGCFISALAEAPGIRRTTPPPRRWHRTNILRAVSCEKAGVPALGGEYFSCTTVTARIARRDMSASDAMAYLSTLGGSAFVKPLRDRAAISRKPFTARNRFDRYLDEVTKVLRLRADLADHRRGRVSCFSARR